MSYAIDFHIHSKSSDDGRGSISDIIVQAKKNGIDAIAICDHNKIFSKENLLDVDEKLLENFVVIPACEFSTDKGHILGLFLSQYVDISYLFENKKVADYKEVIKLIKELGGISVIAHPFVNKTQQEYFDFCKELDGVEVFNSRAYYKNPLADKMAQTLADNEDKTTFAGSDAHSPCEIGNSYTLVNAEKLDINSIYKAVLERKTETILVKKTKRIQKGKSQMIKALRMKKIKNITIGIVYYFYCLLWDILN